MKLAFVFDQGEQCEEFSFRCVVSCQSASEQIALLGFCSRHRATSMVIPLERFLDWEKLTQEGNFAEASRLYRPSLLLWDNEFPFVQDKDTPEMFTVDVAGKRGVVADALIERLKWAECLDELIIGLRQIGLEVRLQNAYTSAALG
jgi:hypothetical protein